MTIKHLVISGGGPYGIMWYGILSYLAKKNFWQVSDIKSIYGCSIGAYVGVLIILGYEWEWIDDYFIKRPWDKLIAASITRFSEIYEKKCLLNEVFLTEAIRPFLLGKDLKDTITMAEFYAITNIEFHMYAANINKKKIELTDISYKTHPDLKLIQALRMTMAAPLIYEPIFIDNDCYVDGGLINNYPLNICIQQQECDPDEILGIKSVWTQENDEEKKIHEKSSMIDFLLEIIKKMRAAIDNSPEQIDTKYTIVCLTEELHEINKWLDVLITPDMRKYLIEKGHERADLFLDQMSN
jgi:predicted acylesterase/phospholipase RssA